MKVRILLFFSFILLYSNSLFSAEGVLDFSSRSSSLALKPGSRVRLKYTDDGRQFGWEHASIVKTTGDTPQDWRENYPDGVVITYNDAPWPDFDLTYTLSLFVTQNSNAIVYMNENGGDFSVQNSNALITCCNDANERITQNSMAIVTMDNDMTLVKLIAQNSAAIITNSNSIVSLDQRVIENSNAIVQSSNSIVALNDYINQNSNFIEDNSWAILALRDDVDENSSAIAYIASISSDLTVENSNAIVHCCSEPFSDPLTSDIVLDKSRFIHPDEQIIIGGDLTIDGQGAVLYFAGKDKPVGPQFVVSPGRSVTLNNIRLVGIASDTFSLMSDASRIIIGQNVVWGLDENVTFTRGKIQITGQNVFNIGGCCGQKRLTFDPAPGNTPMVNLGFSTLALQNIELTGLEHIIHSIVGNITGALGLVGNAAVNIDQTNSMVFYIESLGNVFRILENNLTFNGLLNYAETGDNVLHIDFVLRSPVETLDAKAQLQKGKVPVVNFATDFIYLTSENGIARLIFDDFIAKVNNAANAFVVLENSFLGANKLQVAGDPIWDASADTAKNRFAVEAIELEAVGFTSETAPEFGIPIVVDPGHHKSIDAFIE